MSASGRISVVIPVYNVKQWLGRCLDSVLGQTRAADEIVLIDDGSTDGSDILCDDYANRYANVIAVHQENQGLSAARNKGIAVSSGDYITFLDSDDWFASTFLEEMERILLEYDADVAHCSLARVSSPEEFEKLQKRRSDVHVYTADEFMMIMLRVHSNRCVHYACGKLYKHDVLEPDHFPVGVLNEDVEGCFKTLLNAEKVVETDSELYAYFVNPDSITGATFGENYLNLRMVWERVADLARERRPELAEYVVYNIDRCDFTILCDMIIHGDCETDRVYAGERRESQRRLKKNLRKLMRGPMVARRKAAAFLLAYFYEPIVFAKRKIAK